ncbi:MAG: DUF4145 domain-containing protein [Planctomycetes bacterium]|nr:DUF4145 domain-containing protein [Planctomycetota bacterium]
MSDNKTEKTIWVMCASCGHNHRNHRVLHEKVKRYTDEPYGAVMSIEYHRFVECMGCESLKYVTSTQDPLEHDPYEDGERDFKVYSDAPGTVARRAASISSDDLCGDDGTPLIPKTVWKMYKETLDALNGGIRTLSAGGLRATVEAICLNLGITNGTLQQKIDELATQNLLTTPQAALLHEERYLGNAALHELETPSSQAIEDGLGIVEGLMNTIYILPKKAERLRNLRQGS